MKTKNIQWLKGMFWIPLEEITRTEDARFLLDRVTFDTGLDLCGFVTAVRPTSGSPPNALVKLQGVANPVWLQVPAGLNDAPVVFQKLDEEDEWTSQDVFLAN